MDRDLKSILLSIALAVPILYVLFGFFNPPQCPLEYTQEQIDASNCIIGANIGGMPLFFISVPFVIALSSVLVQFTLRRLKK